MSVRLLLADDSDCMLSAMRHLLEENSEIEIVGEAETFAATIQMLGKLHPDVLLLDLHMPQCGDFTPEFVKSELATVKHVLAVSFSNDDDAKALAESYGADQLLDKMNLYSEMIPAIQHCVSADEQKNDRLTRHAIP